MLVSSSTETAQANAVDYALLLSGLQGGVDGAIDRFLGHYHAEPVTPEQAHAGAPSLDFAIPPELPGGFAMEQAYRVQFGHSAGAAALYRREAEPLLIFFHSNAHSDLSGTYQEKECVIGNHEGIQIQVGSWRLMHFTTRTTCHCVLTTMDPGPELEDLVRAVALDLPNPDSHEHQQHQLAH
jgi:hypothetical protein